MQLRVHIVCARCSKTTEVHMLGGWDISNVQHACEKDPPYVHGPVERGEFKVSFDPPRRGF